MGNSDYGCFLRSCMTFFAVIPDLKFFFFLSRFVRPRALGQPPFRYLAEALVNTVFFFFFLNPIIIGDLIRFQPKGNGGNRRNRRRQCCDGGGRFC
jgi:hypothetical protein